MENPRKWVLKKNNNSGFFIHQQASINIATTPKRRSVGGRRK
jgi:hypothetical protein